MSARAIPECGVTELFLIVEFSRYWRRRGKIDSKISRLYLEGMVWDRSSTASSDGWRGRRSLLFRHRGE
jgi:hypothetical protein